MNVLDLFSGIGGFALGLERAGMRTVAFCERDPFCRAVLAHHWPGIPCHDDVRTLRAEHVGPVDLVCGGPPCQPASLAGKRLGAADDRWLWPEALRVVTEVRPRWALFENPPGFLSMGFASTTTALESLGYRVGTVNLPACGLAAPHLRHRIWIVAHAPDVRGPEIERGEPDGVGELLDGAAADTERWGLEGGHKRFAAPQAIIAAQDDSTGDGDSGPGRQPQPELRRVDDGVPGWLDGRAVPPPVARGVANRVQRLRALGNSVVPQVVEQIGRAIMSAEAA